MATRQRWTLVAAAAVGGVGELLRRRRSARAEPAGASAAGPSAAGPSAAEPAPSDPPPLTTQSSPGQIADLQQAYGADMAPRPAREDAGAG